MEHPSEIAAAPPPSPSPYDGATDWLLRRPLLSQVLPVSAIAGAAGVAPMLPFPMGMMLVGYACAITLGVWVGRANTTPWDSEENGRFYCRYCGRGTQMVALCKECRNPAPDLAGLSLSQRFGACQPCRRPRSGTEGRDQDSLLLCCRNCFRQQKKRHAALPVRRIGVLREEDLIRLRSIGQGLLPDPFGQPFAFELRSLVDCGHRAALVVDMGELTAFPSASLPDSHWRRLDAVWLSESASALQVAQVLDQLERTARLLRVPLPGLPLLLEGGPLPASLMNRLNSWVTEVKCHVSPEMALGLVSGKPQ